MPDALGEMVGQDKLRDRLRVMVKASVLRRAALPHMIFYGAKGTGKTTLARAMANERKVKIVETTGDTLVDKDDVRKLLWMTCAHGWAEVPGEGWWPYEPSEGEPAILFVDEVHRISKEAAESLYHPLEDGTTSMESGKGLTTVHLPPFTMIGATTDAGKLLQPLVTRVRMLYLDPYTEDELTQIARAHATRITHSVEPQPGQVIPEKIIWDEGALQVVAQRSQGTPRVIVQNLWEVYDLALVTGRAFVSEAWATQVMEDTMGIDANGFNPMDRRILARLADAGRPVGLEAMADMMGETVENIRASERYLTEMGALLRTPRGRTISEKGEALLPAAEGG